MTCCQKKAGRTWKEVKGKFSGKEANGKLPEEIRTGKKKKKKKRRGGGEGGGGGGKGHVAR